MMIWKLLKPYFKRSEKWGDPDKMNLETLFLMFRLRISLPPGWVIIINCGYEDRHGGHGRGDAIDFRIVKIGSKEARKDFLQAEKMLQEFLDKFDLQDKVALGIYPEWGGGKRPGFHIEIERKDVDHPRRWGARYIFEKGKQKQEYIAYDLSLEEAKKITDIV
jgi:hypothetical protein